MNTNPQWAISYPTDSNIPTYMIYIFFLNHVEGFNHADRLDLYGPSVTLCSRISRQTPYKGTVAAVVDGVAVIDFGFAARSEMNQCRNAEA